MSIDFQRFPKQLRYWSLHCAINALPSFLIAAIFLELWENKVAVASMVLAVVVFVFGYALVTSINGWLSNPESLFTRAVKIGTRIRLGLSLATFLMVLVAGEVEETLMLAPDFWAGFFAVGVVQMSLDLIGHAPRGLLDGRMGPGVVFASTIVEGIVLSTMLMMFAFFSLIVLQIRTRRRMGEGRRDRCG